MCDFAKSEVTNCLPVQTGKKSEKIMKIMLYIWVNSCYDGQAGLETRRNYYARCSVVGESCMNQYTTRPLLGSEEKFFERWKTQ